MGVIMLHCAWKCFPVLICFLFQYVKGYTNPNNILGLESLYNSANGLYWQWNQYPGIPWVFNSTADPCLDSWEGVNCSGCTNTTVCNVTDLTLNGYMLFGSLPNAICNLTEVSTISLSSNIIKNSIPDCLFNISTIRTMDLSHNAISGILPRFASNSILSYVDLSYNELFGNISTTIGNAGATLSYLNLYGNSLSGGIPTVIGACVALTLLNVGQNQISGVIPADVFSISTLQSLSINENKFTGTIPTTIANSKQLMYLNVQDNALVGTLPNSIGTLSLLQQLLLQNNLINSTLPVSLGYLQQLVVLDLSSNSFYGTVPTNIGNMSSLVNFVIGSNYLVGALPASLGSLTKLKSILISHNRFTHTVPSTISNNILLTSLLLNDNQLVGSFPSCIYSLTDMWRLRLDYNMFNGTISDMISNLAVVTSIELNNNALSGSIPSGLASLYQLQYMDVSYNSLSKTIDAIILSSLSSMTSLYVESNQLSGSIDAGICNMYNLYAFDLSDNMFSGELDPCVWELPLSDFILDNNHFSGSIGEVLSTQFSVVSLRNNRFTGTVPSTLLTLPSLTILTLDNNKLAGQISTIGDAANLQILQAGFNQLSGTFPSSLTTMTTLIIMQLSSNHFHGTIPSSVGNSNTLRLFEILLDGNAFVGTIPLSFGLLTNLELLKVNSNQLTGTVPTCLAVLPNLLALVVNSNQLNGQLSTFFAPFHENPDRVQVLHGVDVSDNNFSGTIPSELFAIATVQLITLSKNCFTGQFPANICSRPELRVLYLDGLRSGKACQRVLSNGIGFGGVSDSTVYTAKYFEDEIPACLFQNLSNLVTLHIAGNGIHSTIPDINTAVSALSTIDMSHNRLFGDIPMSMQTFNKLAALDLSYNRIGGNIQQMTITQNISSVIVPSVYTCTSSQPSLKLKVNRLSGVIPALFDTLVDIDILEGNIFSCTYPDFVLPEHDAYKDEYTCGSDYLDSANYFFVMCVFLALPTICLFASYRGASAELKKWDSVGDTRDGSLVLNKTRSSSAADVLPPTTGRPSSSRSWRRGSSRLGPIDSTSTTIMEGLRELYTHVFVKKVLVIPVALKPHMFHLSSYVKMCNQLRNMCGYVGVVAFIIYMPVYIMFKYIQGGEYATHDYTYGWVLSSVYITGLVPSIVLLLLWILLFLFVIIYSRYARLQINEADRTVDTYDVLRASDKTSFLMYGPVRFLQLVINCSIVLLVNALYIYIESSQATSVRWLAIIFLTVFKLAWNVLVVPRLIDYNFDMLDVYYYASNQKDRMRGKELTHKGSMLLHFSIIVFNYIIAPCLAVAITDSECFLNVFIPASDIVNSFTYDECQSFSISITKEVTCTNYGPAAPVTTSFNAPFIYTYECSDALLSNYIPVFLVQYAFSGIVFPLVRMIVFYYCRYLTIDTTLNMLKVTNKEIKSGSFMWRVFRACIPTVLWPLAYSLKFKARRFNTTKQTGDYLPARVNMYALIGSVAILLTFGMAYPPLAVAIAFATAAQCISWQIILQHHMDDYSNLQEKDSYTELLCRKLEMDCRMIWKSPVRSTSLLLVCCSMFYGLYFLDCYAPSYVFCIIAVSIPCFWHLYKLTLKKWNRNYYKSLNARVMQLAHGIETWYQGARSRMSSTGVMMYDLRRSSAAADTAAPPVSSVNNPMYASSTTIIARNDRCDNSVIV